MSLGVLELIRDRLHKRGLYDSPAYWDKKAVAYEGLARSNWPSNSYNEHVHTRQMQVVDEVLGDVRDLEIADVGCGTGRASVHLARRGATVTGFDFSPRALAVAAREAREASVEVTFTEHDILAAPSDAVRSAFDVVLTVGCLTLACKDTQDLDRALDGIATMLRPGGRALFLEPIHASFLLTRILKLPTHEWIRRCEARGLTLRERRGILFVPSRYALAFRDLPAAVNDPVFALGEQCLGWSRHLERLGDYKVLLFEAPR